MTSPETPAGAAGRLSRPLLRARVAMVALLFAGFAAGLGADRIGVGLGEDAGASTSLADRPEFETLQQTWDLIHDSYIDEDAIDDDALVYGAASGMVEALGDTGHSTFLDPREAEAFEASSRGELIGIGVQLDYSTGRPTIVAPVDGSPADEAGLRTDDVIAAIDGISTDGMSPDQLSTLIRGDVGTQVELTIDRATAVEPFTVTLTRSRITLDPVTWTMLPGDVAHVRLSEFSAGATEDLTESLKAARAAGARAVVFDLRNNPGGLVFEAIGVASQFMAEGTTIYRYQERDEEPRPIKTVGEGALTDLPIAVLINGGSASAAEIVAVAIAQSGRGELYGESTFGTGTVLTPYPLEDGSMVVLGTAFWLSPDGERLWHKGVEPTVPVELPANAQASRPAENEGLDAAALAASDDAQLLAAYDALVAVVAA